MSLVSTNHFAHKIRMGKQGKPDIGDFITFFLVNDFLQFVVEENIVLDHFFEGEFDIAQVMGKFFVSRQSEIPNHGRKQNGKRLGKTGLREVMGDALMKLARDDVLVSHTYFIVKLPERAVADADRHERVKAHEGFGLLALPLPVFPCLESDSVEDT